MTADDLTVVPVLDDADRPIGIITVDVLELIPHPGATSTSSAAPDCASAAVGIVLDPRAA